MANSQPNGETIMLEEMSPERVNKLIISSSEKFGGEDLKNLMLGLYASQIEISSPQSDDVVQRINAIVRGEKIKKRTAVEKLVKWEGPLYRILRERENPFEALVPFSPKNASASPLGSRSTTYQVLAEIYRSCDQQKKLNAQEENASCKIVIKSLEKFGGEDLKNLMLALYATKSEVFAPHVGRVMAYMNAVVLGENLREKTVIRNLSTQEKALCKFLRKRENHFGALPTIGRLTP
jgi:hypothetical protein